jgi:hypothetical protein
MALPRGVLVVVLALAAWEAASAEGGGRSREAAREPDPARVEEALSRGAACLVRDRDGSGFRDPYLAYVYPQENLPSPAGAPPLTYRNVDAAAILVSIGRELEAPVPGHAGVALRTMIDEAETAIAGAAATWRGRGFSNVTQGARPEGIALDTFCTVGWLARDSSMAAEAAAALHGDGWLPKALYDAGDEYRLVADESWCLRLLAATGRLKKSPVRVFERHMATLRDHTREQPGAAGTLYEALHLGMVLAEFASHTAGDPLEARDEVVAALQGWAAARAPDGRTDPRDVLEWANLASADILRVPPVSARDNLRRRAARAILDMQEDDGCWVIPGQRPPRAGATFVTLRALLALAPWLPQSESGRGAGPNPAPQARRPAQ